MQEERVWIPHGDLVLEGKLALGRDLAGLVCHPHPAYGGDMENNVVTATCLGLAAAGASVLRFNFRGLGLTAGMKGEGDLELQEVKAALEFLKLRTGCDASRLVLAGYSFGAWVGLRALREMEPVLGWVAIAPPVALWDFSFCKGIAGGKLVLAGGNDQFCPSDLLQEFFGGLQDPKEMMILAGADHFLGGFESRLRDMVREKVLSWAQALGD